MCIKKIIFILLFTIVINDLVAAIRNVPLTYGTIQAGLDASMNGDTVLVEAGIYYENIVWPDKMNIKLFSNSDSTNTIIDGNLSGRVLTFYGFITIGNDTRVKGFQFRNGFSTDGAGIFVENCSLIFENISINNNHCSAPNWASGAGICLKNSFSSILYSSIHHNYIDIATWSMGGGVYVFSGAPTFDSVNISANHIASTSWSLGAGINITNATSNIKNCIISDNVIDTAQWANGSGAYLDLSTVLIENSSISSNHMRSGSWSSGNGLYAEDCDVDLKNIKISKNTTDSTANWYNGGGAYFIDCNCIMTNALIHSNVMPNKGMSQAGTAIYVTRTTFSSLEIINSTITDNYIDQGLNQGAAIHCEAFNSIELKVKNSICFNTSTSSEIFNSNSVIVSYSDIRGGYNGNNNIQLSPNFVSATDFHLSPISPCLNTANANDAPAFDLDNGIRPNPVGTNPDMGCFESHFIGSGIYIHDVTEEITTYPNPIKDVLFINYKSADATNLKYEIYNLTGQLIHSDFSNFNKKDKVIKVNMSEFQAGIYLLKVINKGNIESLKIIKD